MKQRQVKSGRIIKSKEINRFLAHRKEIEIFREEREKFDSEKGRIEVAHETIRLKEALLDNLLHELRHINGGLKDSIDLIDFEEYPNLRDIWAQANLLSIRMLMYDYEVNPEILTDTKKTEVPIYKRVDKVAKCFKHLRGYKKSRIWLEGETYLTFPATDILELAFYIILHNAVKYALTGSQIKVEFTEQLDPLNINNTLTVSFINDGLIPSESDMPHLSERGYRGDNSHDIKGTGIGLYMLKQICNASGINLHIRREPNNLDDTTHGRFIVLLTFENCHQRMQLR